MYSLLATPLSIPHPRSWLDRRPKFFFHVGEGRRLPNPTHVDAVAAEFESVVFSQLLRHALRLLAFELPYDPDSGGDWLADPEGDLAGELERDLYQAGRRSGISFHDGRANSRLTLEGSVSRRWVSRACHRVAELALDYYDDSEAQRRHAAAVKGGTNSKRGPTYTLATTQLPDVPSVPAIIEALACSRSTAQRLRRQARADVA